jgi:hypothetical protein
VLAGHSHLYERIERDGVQYVTTGGGSAVVYPHGNPLEGTHAVHSVSHYLYAEIHENRLELKAYDIDNKELDSASWDY